MSKVYKQIEPKSTVAEILQHIEENYSSGTAFNYLEGGHWKHVSTEAFIFDIKRMACGLISLGLKRGDKVGILAQPSPWWTMVDLAVMMAGGITVPLMSRASHDNIIYEVAQSNVCYTFIHGRDEWNLYLEQKNLFNTVIGLDPPEGLRNVLLYYDILQAGEALWEKEPKLWGELAVKLHADDVCSIIYTAGAIGMPKGVEMTQRAFCHLVGYDVYNWDSSKDVYLGILPLAHVFARQINLIMLSWGVDIYYLNDLSQLKKVSEELQPTLMIVVPRLLERMYDTMIMAVDKEKNWMKRVIGQWAFNLANNPRQGLIRKFLLRPIADVLVYRPIRESLGGKWRVILCGGAALSVPLQKFFLNIGMPIFEGWGLTEGSTVCVNRPSAFKVGTVGIPLPGLKIKLTEEDEVLVAGPTVMKGYYRNPEVTKKTIDDEGWLHTGDKGKIDEEGFLTLIGRVKEQFKLSSGEYVSPSRIEHYLRQHPLVDQAMVFGERYKNAVCFLFPHKEIIARWKEKHNLENLTDDEFVQTDLIKKEMKMLLEKTSSRFNRWERLTDYRFIFDEPTIEEGLLTPTLKLRRNAILKKYQHLVDAIYGLEKS